MPVFPPLPVCRPSWDGPIMKINGGIMHFKAREKTIYKPSIQLQIGARHRILSIVITFVILSLETSSAQPIRWTERNLVVSWNLFFSKAVLRFMGYLSHGLTE